MSSSQSASRLSNILAASARMYVCSRVYYSGPSRKYDVCACNTADVMCALSSGRRLTDAARLTGGLDLTLELNHKSKH